MGRFNGNFRTGELNISLAAPETPFSAKRFRALQALALSKGSGAAPYKVKKIIKQRLEDTPPDADGTLPGADVLYWRAGEHNAQSRNH